MNDSLTNEKLKELLVPPGYVEGNNFESAQKEAEQQKLSLRDLLIQKGYIKSEQLGTLVADSLGYPYVNLRNERIDQDVFFLIPEGIARSQGIIAFKKTDQGICVGMTNPEDLETLNLTSKKLGQNVTPYYMTMEDLRAVLPRYREELKKQFGKFLDVLSSPSIQGSRRDEITVKIVETLLQYGFYREASDIHVEPHEDKLTVRFRVDGVLHDVLEVPKELSDVIVTRIKILSRLRTDEHFAAQDGKFSFEVDDEEIDVRVSVVPVTKGESVVMRLLTVTSRELTLNNLGFSDKDLEIINRVIKNPHGMILVTGPTGSGKTTSLYAVMKVINNRELHIASIEDPVEYDIEGVSQIQVNPGTNLTFADGLRAIVRQDPDVIMVGEIRDEETAGISAHAALTGHLVLSTLHANDASTAPLRLIDMGLEPFLVISTVNVVIAQRLVRKICMTCRGSYEFGQEDQLLIDSNDELKGLIEKYKSSRVLRLYKGNGCEMCGGTGYRGRIGIFEVLELDDDIRKMIIDKAPHGEIVKVAVSKGMTALLEEGVRKMVEGVTTLEEVLRVVGEQDEN